MITLLVGAVCLFVLGLLFGRRFGVLVLALTAGLVVSQETSSYVIRILGPYLTHYISYVPAAMVVLPSLVLLLFAKGRHRKILHRMISAAIYALAGLVFVIAAPGTPASLTNGLPILTNNLGLIITGLVVTAVLEVAFGKPSKKKSIEEAKK